MEVLKVLCFVTVLFTGCASAAPEQFKHIAPVSIDEDRYLQLLSRVENLEKRDQEQQEDIHMLRSELNTEKQRTSRLEAKITRLMQTLSKHEDVDTRTAVDVEGSRDQDADTVNTDENVSDTRYAKHSDVPTFRIRRQEHIPVVAFHATLTRDQEHSEVHQAIAFNNAITNIGGAYNPHYGTFMAPVSGVYVFSTTILEYGHLEMSCSIVKNGGSVANLYMRDDHSVLDGASATVVLHLNKGDDIAVQNASTDMTIRGSSYSMFSGFLLQEDQQDVGIVGK